MHHFFLCNICEKKFCIKLSNDCVHFHLWYVCMEDKKCTYNIFIYTFLHLFIYLFMYFPFYLSIHLFIYSCGRILLRRAVLPES